MDEVLDCFLLDGPLAELPEAASLQPCIEQLSIPIHYADDKTAVGETSLSFALMNVHARAEGAKKHATALRQLMMEIVSAPLSSQTWVGEAKKDPAPHLTARQEQTVKLLESHKAPFRRYPECFLCLVGLSPYYPFDDNSYPAFVCSLRKAIGYVLLFVLSKLADLEGRGGGGSDRPDIPVPTERWQESVAEEDAYMELVDPGKGTAMVRQSDEEVVTEQPKKIKKKILTKQSHVPLAKRLRTDHPSLASGTGGKTLAGLEQIMPAGSCFVASGKQS
ncbi:hypothetical protein Tco_1009591 [Tanacetum coccineum]